MFGDLWTVDATRCCQWDFGVGVDGVVLDVVYARREEVDELEVWGLGWLWEDVEG